MRDTQPTFAERVAQMHDVAEQLKSIAEIVAEEAIRMAAAERRFSKRRSDKAKGEPAKARPITNPISISQHMSTPYNEPIMDDGLAGGSCPYCGQPIAIVEIESAEGGVRFEHALRPPEYES